MIKVYISGGITGIENYMEQFKEAQTKFECESVPVVNPALVCSNLPRETEYEEYMQMALCMLEMCDTVYFLKGWEESRGSNREYGYAIAKGKTILFQEDEEHGF